MTDFQTDTDETQDAEVLEFLSLRAIANGGAPTPPGETSDERFAREERLGELYRLLKADGRMPRLSVEVPGFASERGYSRGSRGFA